METAALTFTLLLAANNLVQVPEACRALAERNGYPMQITQTQAALALAALRMANKNDPDVQRCRAAITLRRRL